MLSSKATGTRESQGPASLRTTRHGLPELTDREHAI